MLQAVAKKWHHYFSFRSGSSEQLGVELEEYMEPIQHSNLAGQGQQSGQEQESVPDSLSLRVRLSPAGQEDNNQGAQGDEGRIQTLNLPNVTRKKPQRIVHFDARRGCVTLPSVLMGKAALGGAVKSTSASDSLIPALLRAASGRPRPGLGTSGIILGTEMLMRNGTQGGKTMDSSESCTGRDQQTGEPIYASVDSTEATYASLRSNIRSADDLQPSRSRPASPHVTHVVGNTGASQERDCASSLPGSVNSHIVNEEDHEEVAKCRELAEDELVRCCYKRAKSMTRSNAQLYCKSLPSPIVLPSSTTQRHSHH